MLEKNKAEQAAPLLQATQSGPPAIPTVALRSWLRLAVVFLLCIICGGILPGQTIFTQLFADAGIYSEMCEVGTIGCEAQYLILANTFGALSAVSFAAFLPAGLLFDALGGRYTGVAGAAILLVGIATLQLCISLHQDWLFPIAVIFTDCGSLVNSLCIYSFLFHLPGWNGVLVALSNCNYFLSAFVPVIMQRAMAAFGFSFADVLGIYVLAIMVCMGILYMLLPSQKEYYLEAQRVMGVPMPRPRFSWSKIKKTTKTSWECLQLDLWRHVELLLVCMAAYSGVFVYMTLPQPFGQQLFNGSRQSGVQLGTMVTTTAGFLGAIFGPLTGIMMDKAGLQPLILLEAAALAVCAFFCRKASWFAQTIAVSGANFFLVTNTLLMSRYVLYFTPPTRIGTMQGVFFFFLSMSFIPVALGMSAIIALWPDISDFSFISGCFGVPQKADEFAAPTMLFSTAGVLAFLALSWSFHKHGLPSEPPLLPQDELELSRRFMVSNLDDAAHVLGINKKEILRLSASQNVLDMRLLVKLMANSGDRLTEVARKRCAAEPIVSRSKFRAVDPSDLYDPMTSRAADPSAEILSSKFLEKCRASNRSESGSRRWMISDRSLSATSATAFTSASFFPPAGADYPGSPLIPWLLGDSISACQELASYLRFQDFIAYHACSGFGHILELRCSSPVEPYVDDPNENNMDRNNFAGHEKSSIVDDAGITEVASMLFCLPPSNTMRVGSQEYFHAISEVGTAVPYISPQVNARMMSMDSVMEENHPTWKHWYVFVLASSGSYRGLGCAAELLRVVKGWAERDRVRCYLVTDGKTARFYEKQGFSVIWREKLDGGSEESNSAAEELELCGLATPPIEDNIVSRFVSRSKSRS